MIVKKICMYCQHCGEARAVDDIPEFDQEITVLTKELYKLKDELLNLITYVQSYTSHNLESKKD